MLIYYRTKGEFRALLEGMEKHGYRNVFALTEDSWDQTTAKMVAATVGPREEFILNAAEVGVEDKAFYQLNATCAGAAVSSGIRIYTVRETYYILEGLTETGKLYYPSGSLRFEGEYIPDYFAVAKHSEQYLQGRLYYEDGTLYKEGVFQRGGLRRGRQYYPNGQLTFAGVYNFRERGSNYGPAYPMEGKLYDEEGNLIFDGEIPVERSGSVAYPYVKTPNGKLGCE